MQGLVLSADHLLGDSAALLRLAALEDQLGEGVGGSKGERANNRADQPAPEAVVVRNGDGVGAMSQ